MKLENQVVSLELAQKLKELGVKQKSLFYWKHIVGTKEGCFYKEVSMYATAHIGGVDFELICSAFTVAELGELLPKWSKSFRTEEEWDADCYMAPSHFTAETEADARAKMLCHLIENKLI